MIALTDRQNTKEQPKPSGKASHSPIAPAVSAPQKKIFKERDWADRTDMPESEPYEETYRDGSMKNECW